MDLSDKTREAAANFLHNAIMDAVMDSDQHLSRMARGWLFLDAPPRPSEITNPHPLGFIVACKKLGVDWYELNQVLRQAVDIGEQKRHLTLVQAPEPCHNLEHENTITLTNRYYPSQRAGSFNQLHCAPLSAAEIAQVAHSSAETKPDSVSDYR